MRTNYQTSFIDLWKIRAIAAERERDELLARQDRNEKAMDIIDRAAKLLEAEPDMLTQIASLTAERDELREALTEIVNLAVNKDIYFAQTIARAALEAKP